MGVSTLRVQGGSLPDVVQMLHSMGIRFLGSRDGDEGVVHLIIEGKGVPEADKVTAYVHQEQTIESHSLRLTFEEDRW